MESATALTQAPHEGGRSRQGQEENHHFSGPRTIGLHLGHWHQSRDYRQAASSGLTERAAGDPDFIVKAAISTDRRPKD